MWLELGVLVGVMVVLRLMPVHGVPGLLLGVLSFGVLVTFLWRCGVWAERVARRKGVYHPQYFVLGPIGLVMALLARRR